MVLHIEYASILGNDIVFVLLLLLTALQHCKLVLLCL